ncbi:hypothetical protein [Gemmata massiliana]|uniref:hypothetical protein n=1 Tax=Gemmata massiliana TaxID=1210884 RepID=UPI0013A6A004|nr:hypothetical protein [Gemmata massiliana]
MIQNPLEARIGALLKIQEHIAAIRGELGNLPVAYYPDVAAALRAVADSLIGRELAHTPSTTAITAARPNKANGVAAKKPSGAVNTESTRSKAAGIRERMIQFFADRSNAPATISDIAASLNVPTTGITTILYRRNTADEFQGAGKVSGTGAAPAKLWKLSEEALNKQRQESTGLFEKE